METKPNIEDQVDAALRSAKNIEQVELPSDFSDRVVNKLYGQKKVRWIYSAAPFLRIAAIFIIVLINVLTLRLVLTSQPAPGVSQNISIKDFVNDYRINDANEELVTTNNIPNHEQP